MTLTHGALHSAIGRHFIGHGTAPSIAQLRRQLALHEVTVADALRALADCRGVVLHPTADDIDGSARPNAWLQWRCAA